MRYPDLSEELNYSGGHRDSNEMSRAEKYFPEVNDRGCPPDPRGWYNLMPPEKVAIGVYFKNLLGIAAIAKSIAKYVPDKVERWKMRFKNDTNEFHCVRYGVIHRECFPPRFLVN